MGAARRKGRNWCPLSEYKLSSGSGCFSARIAVRQTQRKAFLFPMGQEDRSILRHWEKRESQEGFLVSPYGKQQMCCTPVPPLSSLFLPLPCPFFPHSPPSPPPPPFCFMDSSCPERNPGLRIRRVYHKASIVEPSQMTLIDMSTFLSFLMQAFLHGYTNNRFTRDATKARYNISYRIIYASFLVSTANEWNCV